MHSTSRRRWLWLLAALSPLAQADWSQLPSAVTVTQTPRAFDRVTKQLFSYATITNTATEAVPGPFRLVIPSSNLGVTNATGTTTDGKPYLTFGGTALAPGQRLTVRVNFTNTASRLTYTTQPERYTDPTLAITAPRTVTEGETVSPVGFAGGSLGSVTYEWSQESGPKITLVDETTNQPTFIAPTVTDRTLVVLKALITDPDAPSGYGVSSTKVDIDVVPDANHVVQATTSGLLAYTGDAVSLHANCTGLASPAYDYAWTQVSPATPVITLIDPDTANPTFTAPDSTAIPANSAETFTFQVTCTGPGGVTAVDKTSILISGPIVLRPNAPLTVSGASGVPPQPLTLQGSTPSPTVVSGDAFQLAVPVFGGTAPYNWLWTPTDGGPALTVDPNTGVASGVAPSVGVATTYHYTVQVTDSGSGNKTTTVAVNLIPAPVPSTPLSVSFPPNALYFGEGQQNIALPMQAAGGTGPYTYNWEYLPFHNGPAVTLTGANTSHASFNAPLVNGDTNLGFRVTVTDSASHSVVGTISVRINDLAPSLNVSTTSPITAKVGETVSLNFPMPQGGAGGYSYAISQTGGTTATLSSTTSRNPTFTVPSGASGDQTFVMTVTDSAGNQVQATQTVSVEAPPLNVTLSGPDHGEEGSTVSLNAVAAGGTGSYTYAYSVSGASVTIPAVANPSFTLPSVPSGSTLDLAVTLTVTDSSSPTPHSATSVFNVTVNKPAQAPVYYSALCDGKLCLIVEPVTPCDAQHPYAMTTVEDDSSFQRQIRKWCGSADEARSLWWDLTSDNNGGCMSLLYPGDGFPQSPNGVAVTCHFACKPRGANIGDPDYACNGGNIVPDRDTLMNFSDPNNNPDTW